MSYSGNTMTKWGPQMAIALFDLYLICNYFTSIKGHIFTFHSTAYLDLKLNVPNDYEKYESVRLTQMYVVNRCMYVCDKHNSRAV